MNKDSLYIAYCVTLLIRNHQHFVSYLISLNVQENTDSPLKSSKFTKRISATLFPGCSVGRGDPETNGGLVDNPLFVGDDPSLQDQIKILLCEYYSQALSHFLRKTFSMT